MKSLIAMTSLVVLGVLVAWFKKGVAVWEYHWQSLQLDT